MDVFLCLLWLGASTETLIHLETSGKVVLSEAKAGRTTEGGTYCHDRRRLAAWSPSGALVHTVEVPGFEIHAAFVEGEHYWLSGLSHNRPHTYCFQKDRQIAERPGLFIPYFNQVDERLFIPYKLSMPFFGETGDYFYHNNHIFCVTQCTLEPHMGEIRVTPTDLEFYQLTPDMLKLELNFKRLWIVRDNQDYLVLNQIEPLIRRFTPSAIARERASGEETYHPTAVTHPLSLPHLAPAPDHFWSPEKTTLRAKVLGSYRAWWRALGLITFFGGGDGRYVVGYQNPDNTPTGQAKPYEVFVRLDEHFNPTGSERPVNGLIAGADATHLYILRFPPQGPTLHILRWD